MKTNLLCQQNRNGAPSEGGRSRFALGLASDAERETIYRIRHDVYAAELGQHPVNASNRLRDPLDEQNIYLVVRVAGQVAGFVSITPPGTGTYSIDKYFARDALPFAITERLYEVRLLTVLKPHRGRELATLLMYAAFRWIEAHGGTHLIAIGREEILDLYLRAALKPVGLTAQSGSVTYHLLHAGVPALRQGLQNFSSVLQRIEERTDWQLSFSFRKPAACFHGGAFFGAIGERFDALERRGEVINADVLDAWFPPSPKVIAALEEHLPWLLRTSPPTACEGLIERIAAGRAVSPGNILPGAGSSDLIFRALRQWLTPSSHALILDPTYGEYAHVLENVIGCTVDRFTLSRARNYDVNLDRIAASFSDGYDLVVLVNPNSPTGRHVPGALLERVIRSAPQRTRFWIDETYIEYAGAALSLEPFAARSENVIICKSMSKVCALSGARVAYLCAAPHQLETLRAITPPWVVSLPAQVAAVRALEDPDYYAARYRETAVLREELRAGVERLGWDTVEGVANFVLCHLPEPGPDARSIVRACREHGLFLRDAGAMGSCLGSHALRIAVKDAATNARMIEIIGKVLPKPR